MVTFSIVLAAILVLALISIIYGALLAVGQRDIKRLVAYASISHFGFIILGIFAMTSQGQSGATLYMVNHGISTAALMPTWDAKTIGIEDGQLKVHDGPYAETREQLGGFYLINAASMDEALDWAKKCPAAQWGAIEVRELFSDYADAPGMRLPAA